MSVANVWQEGQVGWFGPEATLVVRVYDVGYSWIDTLKATVAVEISDEQLANAKFKYPLQTPLSKEEYYYRSIFTEHFPSDAAALCVPQEASVACSTKIALEWDEAFKNMNDPSGRAVANVHDDAYVKI